MKVVQIAPALLSFSNKQPSCHLNGWSLKTGLTVLQKSVILESRRITVFFSLLITFSFKADDIKIRNRKSR